MARKCADAGDHASLWNKRVAIHRSELMAALVRSLEQERLYTNMQGIGFEQDEDGVRLRFASGEEVQGDLLIGADGLHSIVRSQLFGATKPRYAGYTAWRAVTHFPKDQFEAQTAFETWGGGNVPTYFGLISLVSKERDASNLVE